MKILSKQELYELLSSRFDGDDKKLSEIPSPSLLQNASKAAARIADAIRNNEKITLVGDYDGFTIKTFLKPKEIGYGIEVPGTLMKERLF